MATHAWWSSLATAPTYVSDEMDIITFYNELCSFAQQIHKHNMLIIKGDMNAQIDKDGSYKFGLQNQPIINGKYLTDFLLNKSFIPKF